MMPFLPFYWPNYVRDTIGRRLLKDIKYSDIKRFYSYLLEERNLSISTVNGVHALLHPVFNMAVRDDIVRKNPTDSLMKELCGSWTYEKKERVVLPREQAIVTKKLTCPRLPHLLAKILKNT